MLILIFTALLQASSGKKADTQTAFLFNDKVSITCSKDLIRITGTFGRLEREHADQEIKLLISEAKTKHCEGKSSAKNNSSVYEEPGGVSVRLNIEISCPSGTKDCEAAVSTLRQNRKRRNRKFKGRNKRGQGTG